MKRLTLLLVIILSAFPVFGEVGVIVNKDLYPQIQSAITAYADNIQAREGKSVWLNSTSFDVNTDIALLKDSLIEHYNSHNLEGVVLVGDLPIAMFEIENDGGDGYADFPCDLYFMDLDGSWLDNAHTGDWNGNAQDGHFDGHVAGSGTREAEIWISRIIGSSVPDLGEEVPVTLDYLGRVKDRMLGMDPFAANCLTMGNNWNSADWWTLGRDMVEDLGYTENEMIFYQRPFDRAGTWKNEIRKGYEYVNIYEHSSEGMHEFTGQGFYNYNYTDMADNGGISDARFYNLYACSNSRYTYPNFLGGLYAWGHNGLLSVGSTKTGGMLGFHNYNQELVNGKCFGEAFRLWFNTTGINNVGFHYGMTLLGAGTLRLARYPAVAIEGPADLKAVAVGPFVQLTWTDHSNNETGFRIERAAQGESFTEYATVGADLTGYINRDDAAAGIKYCYRVQAYNNADNSIYSNIDSATVSANMAPEGTATASSQFNANFSPDRVNDNDTLTRWAALNTTFPEWVMVDLGSERSVSSVQMYFAFPGTAGDCYDFTVETSSDNTTWTEALNNNPNSNTNQIQAYPLNAVARYVRLTITGAPGSYRASLYEFRVITGVEPAPPENLSSTDDYWDQVKLSWNEPAYAFARASSYTVKRSTIPGGPYTWSESRITGTEFVTSNLERQHTYYFVVCGVNDAGESAPSAQIQVVAPWSPPIPPDNLSITPNQYMDGYTLDWDDNSHGQSEYFRIERRQMINSSWTAWTQIGNITADQLTYVDATADNTSLYEYRVYAFNTANGLSGPSNVVNTQIHPASPNLDPPVQIGNSIQLHWDFGGRTHDGFIVKRSVNMFDFDELAVLGPEVRDYTDNNFDLGTVYIYLVCAYNEYPGQGCSDYQFIATVFTIDAPTNLTGTVVSSSAIALAWDDNSTDEDQFRIEVATAADGPFTQAGSVAANVHTFTVNGLNAETGYFFRVKAVNGTGYSDYSNIFSATTPVQTGPNAPTNLVAAAVAPNQINLAWDDNANDENWFAVERSVDGGTTWSPVTTLGANVVSYINTNLTGSTTYSYRVRAGNAQGASAWSNTATATTPSGGYGNLAIGKAASASSEFSASYSAANVTDDNATTRWAASNGSFPQWITVDLGSQRMVNEVEFMFKMAGTGGDCYDFTVQTSADNVTWTARIDQSNNTNTAQTQRYGLGVTARYFRITFSDAPGTAMASIFEFRLFGQQ